MDGDAKRRAIEANWRLEDLREVPFIIEVGDVHLATGEFFGNPEREIAWSADQESKNRGVYDYWLPSVKPNQGIGLIAEAFGCTAQVNDEADPWIAARISEDNLDDIAKLEVPDPATNPVLRRALAHVARLQDISPYPLRLLNVASPLVTASQIWNYTSFIEATMLYPDEVHALMDKVTQATIAYVRAQFALMKNRFSVGHEAWYIPDFCGVRVSDDTATLLSPDLYREFGVKYNSMIGNELGGIVVHSCGDVGNVVGAMMEIEGLKGLDFTIPQTPDWSKISDAASGKTALCLRHFFWDHGKDAGVDLAEYSKKIVDHFGRKGLFIQTSTRTGDEAVVLGERMHRLLSR